MLSFGQRLKLIRKEAQITQSELAEKLFVTVQSVSKWECDTSMPDIFQIVPLAAILGVTTDCLLGVGTDEKADTEKLNEEIDEYFKIYSPFHYEENVFRKSFKLCKEHIKKYPLDYTTKLRCAKYMFLFLDHATGGNCYTVPKEEEDITYNEAIRHLTSLLNYDRDVERVLHAKKILAYLYLYKDNFEKAEEVAENLPQVGNIRNHILLEIYDKKKDYDKCIEISNSMVELSTNDYLLDLWIRARRISILGNDKKHEAIAAWHEFKEAAMFNHKLLNRDFTMHYVASGLSMLSNDHIAISEFDEAFQKIEELTDFLINYYNEIKSKGTEEEINELRNFCRNSLVGCYNWCFPTSDNIIANDPRYKACEAKIADALK